DEPLPGLDGNRRVRELAAHRRDPGFDASTLVVLHTAQGHIRRSGHGATEKVDAGRIGPDDRAGVVVVDGDAAHGEALPAFDRFEVALRAELEALESGDDGRAPPAVGVEEYLVVIRARDS